MSDPTEPRLAGVDIADGPDYAAYVLRVEGVTYDVTNCTALELLYILEDIGYAIGPADGAGERRPEATDD